jgi:hypothetical protein
VIWRTKTLVAALAVTMTVCRATAWGDAPGAIHVQQAFAGAEVAFMAHVRKVLLGERGSDGTFVASAEVQVTDCFLGAKCSKGKAQLAFSIGEGPPPISAARDYLFVLARDAETGRAYSLGPTDQVFVKLDPLMFYEGKKSVPPRERYLFKGPRCGELYLDEQATRADLIKWGRARAQLIGPPTSGRR